MYLTLTTWNAEFLGQGNRANQLPEIVEVPERTRFFSWRFIKQKPSDFVLVSILVGGLEHEFFDFPFSWEFHHPD